MEFPFNHGHHHHTHHHRREDEQDNPPYPPPGSAATNLPNNPYPPPPQHPQPPFYGGGMDQPPPPQRPHDPVTQVYHTSHVPPPGHVSHDFNNYASAPPPPPPSSSVYHHQHEPNPSSFGHAHPSAPPYYPPPPAPSSNVHHLSHVSHHPDSYSNSGNVHHVSHHGGLAGPAAAEFSNKPTVRVVTKANPNYSLTIRHGKVILARSDPRDQYQHWYKDEKYSTRVKDSEGCPAFSLVNKVTGEAIKHSIGATHPVQLIPYNSHTLDESVLWTESRDLGDGHRAIRMVSNIRLNVDAYHGDKNSGGVHDGTTIVLWDWNKGDNQRWKIIPY